MLAVYLLSGMLLLYLFDCVGLWGWVWFDCVCDLIEVHVSCVLLFIWLFGLCYTLCLIMMWAVGFVD